MKTVLVDGLNTAVESLNHEIMLIWWDMTPVVGHLN